MMQIKILECSSKGDKCFSAFYAKVAIWGKYDSIENHYQLCKRFGEYVPRSWKDAKGKEPTHIVLNGRIYDVKYLSQWYKILWVKYLDDNPELVKYASQFDEFNDIFKGKSLNCQADVIRQYIKQGRESLVHDYQELWNLFFA
ncbi:DarT1-associated NADAR antitoxin family protein [Paenibacillus dendritiformis]|uniref:DarT1-associated NADAR antitoxin family protein n=1 Tax=Paenibacillus dendritiformis TaxID=130049 RepID=UPI00387E14CE